MNVAEGYKYSRETIPVLEKSVENQICNNSYYLDENLTLMKLYQFFPEERKLDMYAKIMAQALLHLEDFLPCFYLLPYKLQCMEPFCSLQLLAQNLEASNFEYFWKEVESVDVLKQITSFRKNARRQVADIISLSYQEISLEVVSKALGCDEVGSTLKDFLAELNWTVKGHLVLVPDNFENITRQRKFEESIQLRQVSPLLQSLDQ